MESFGRMNVTVLCLLVLVHYGFKMFFVLPPWKLLFFQGDQVSWVWCNLGCLDGHHVLVDGDANLKAVAQTQWLYEQQMCFSFFSAVCHFNAIFAYMLFKNNLGCLHHNLVSVIWFIVLATSSLIFLLRS